MVHNIENGKQTHGKTLKKKQNNNKKTHQINRSIQDTVLKVTIKSGCGVCRHDSLCVPRGRQAGCASGIWGEGGGLVSMYPHVCVCVLGAVGGVCERHKVEG